MTNHPLALALALHDQNCATIPMVPGKKVPFKGFALSRYFEKRPTLAELPVLFNRQNLSIAVLGGIPSDCAIIADSDDPATHRRMYDSLGINTRAARSRRGGHTYLRTTVPVYGQSPFAELQLKGQGGYAIVPSDKSPNYKWENDFDIALWDSLELPNPVGPGYIQLKPVPPRDRRIPHLAWGLITGTILWSTRYKTRSDADCGAVTSCINKGLDFHAIVRLYDEHAYEGTHYKWRVREKGIDEAHDWLQRTYDRCAVWVSTHQSEAVLIARDLQEWLISAPFTGRGGESERQTLRAHAELQEQCAKIYDYSADVRTLAEHAGISWQTVSRANHRLIQMGLLVCTKQHTATLPSMYSLTPLAIEKAQGVKFLEHTPPGGERGGVNDKLHTLASHDVFRSKWNHSKKTITRGLTPCQKATWMYLCRAGEGLRASQIAKQIGKSKRAVLTALAGLKPYRMVKEMGGLWYGCPDADLDAIAEYRCTKFAHLSQLARHERERRVHAWKLCKYEGRGER